MESIKPYFSVENFLKEIKATSFIKTNEGKKIYSDLLSHFLKMSQMSPETQKFNNHIKLSVDYLKSLGLDSCIESLNAINNINNNLLNILNGANDNIIESVARFVVYYACLSFYYNQDPESNELREIKNEFKILDRKLVRDFKIKFNKIRNILSNNFINYQQMLIFIGVDKDINGEPIKDKLKPLFSNYLKPLSALEQYKKFVDTNMDTFDKSYNNFVGLYLAAKKYFENPGAPAGTDPNRLIDDDTDSPDSYTSTKPIPITESVEYEELVNKPMIKPDIDFPSDQPEDLVLEQFLKNFDYSKVSNMELTFYAMSIVDYAIEAASQYNYKNSGEYYEHCAKIIMAEIQKLPGNNFAKLGACISVFNFLSH